MSTSSTEQTADQQTPGTQQTPPPAAPKPGDETGRVHTQADLDRVLRERLAEQQRKHDQQLEQVRGDANKSETDRLKAEAERANTRAEQAAQKAGPRVAKAEAQLTAITAGGRPDRAAAIVRQADLDGVVKFDGDDWTIDDDKVRAAIDAVLDEYPEWKADAEPAPSKSSSTDKTDDGKGKTRPPAASGGDLNGAGSDDPTLEQFQRMTMRERSELSDTKPDVYRRLADAEIDAKRGR